MKLKKVSRVIFVILILIFIFSMLLWSIPFGRAESLKITAQEIIALENDNISSGQILLPGNPFYFLKNWAWGIKKIFTADKINWHLGFTASRLLDIKALSEKKSDSLDRINKAIAYYEEASQKSEQFINNSSSDNKKASLEKIAKNFIFYKKLFNNILSSQISEEIKAKIFNLSNQKQDYFINILIALNDPNEVLKVFSDEIVNNKGIFSGLQDLYLKDILESIISGKKEIIASFQDKLYLRSLAAFNNAAFIYGDILKDIMDVLPGDKKNQRQALRDWNARSGQNELFEKILGNMNDSFLNNEDIKKCLNEVEVIKKQISVFKDFVGNNKISSNAESFLIIAEGTLKHALERITTSEEKYACNLIQSSQAAITNAWRLINLANKNNIDIEIAKVEKQTLESKNITGKYNQNENQRLFDLIKEMDNQLLSIQASYEVGDFESILQKVDEFGIILNNFNFVLDVLNGNKIIAQELRTKKEFFNKGSLERFGNNCSNQGGSLIDRFTVLPFCRLKSGEILIMQ